DRGRWLLRGMARRPRRDRHASAAPLWHGRTETEISAEALVLRIRRGVLPHRTSDRLRRHGHQNPRRSVARWSTLHPERPEDVDYQRRQSGFLYGFRKNRR